MQSIDELYQVRQYLLELAPLARSFEESFGVGGDGAQAVPLLVPATSASRSSRAWEMRRSCSSRSMERPMTCSQAWTTMSATSLLTSRTADSRSLSISSRARWMMRSPSSRASLLVRSRWASACLRASSRMRRPSPRASSMDFSIGAWRSWICLRIGGNTYRISKNTRMRKVMTSQKIKLVLPRSKIPVGSSCASTIAMGTPFPALLEHEGDEQGEYDAVERERLHETYPQEHERPGLVEGLRLTVYGGYGLPDQI